MIPAALAAAASAAEATGASSIQGLCSVMAFMEGSPLSGFNANGDFAVVKNFKFGNFHAYTAHAW
ncbi:hypothetical protein D3C78_1886330 [compost metagenome]